MQVDSNSHSSSLPRGLVVEVAETREDWMDSVIDLYSEHSEVPRRICRNDGTCRKIGADPEHSWRLGENPS